MSKKRRGFTMIEVSLFLVMTAVIFVGIVMGTQNSIFQQRYNDAVQSFADFLRNNYSQTTNVQSDGTGTSDQLIYGRLISFSSDKVTSYSVIGENTKFNSDGSALSQLIGAKAMVGKSESGGQLIGFTETYIPKWGSKIQVKTGSGFEIFRGAILIVRHPETGSVHTYVTNNSVSEGEAISSAGFDEPAQLDLCVNPNGDAESNLRKDIRIVRDAKNASGVILVPDDDSGNKCK